MKQVTFGAMHKEYYHPYPNIDFWFGQQWVGYIEKLSVDGRAWCYDVHFDDCEFGENRTFYVRFSGGNARAALKRAKDYVREMCHEA